MKHTKFSVFFVIFALSFVSVRAGLRSYFNNYMDEMALSSCIGLSASHGKAGHITAIRRTCSNLASDCSSVCSQAKIPAYVTGSKWSCFDSLHIYKKPENELKDNYDAYVDSGKVGLYAYRYNTGCTGKYCGPNYCCCVGV